MQYLEVHGRASGHPAKSASEKPYTFSELWDKIWIPKFSVLLTYRNTGLIACSWTIEGECISWDNKLTE